MFANDPVDWGSIPGQVIPKTSKMVLDASLFNTQHFEVHFKGKWNNSRKGTAPSHTAQCRSYRKESFWVALNYDQIT